MTARHLAGLFALAATPAQFAVAAIVIKYNARVVVVPVCGHFGLEEPFFRRSGSTPYDGQGIALARRSSIRNRCRSPRRSPSNDVNRRGIVTPDRRAIGTPSCRWSRARRRPELRSVAQQRRDSTQGSIFGADNRVRLADSHPGRTPATAPRLSRARKSAVVFCIVARIETGYSVILE